MEQNDLGKASKDIGKVYAEKDKASIGHLDMQRQFFQTQSRLAFFIVLIFASAVLVSLFMFLWKALYGVYPPDCKPYSIKEIGQFMEYLTSFALKIFMPIITLVLGFYYGKKTK